MDVNFPVIILAAGSSSRFGSPKQLLTFESISLLEHTIDEIKKSNAQHIIVVLGANVDQITDQIKFSGISVIHNKSFASGISSSIIAGLQYALEKHPMTSGVLITVCEQPFINAPLIDNLIDTSKKTEAPIVACQYANTYGVPVFFHKRFFSELLNLTGDKGAKKIIQSNIDLATLIAFPEGSVDIDTKEDYEGFIMSDRKLHK